MTPTLIGRLQTRIFLAATVGVLWTAAITPALSGLAGMSVSNAYHMTFRVLGLMTLLGLGWEVIYHVLQQARWDKDWPSMFALLAVVIEAVPLWYVAHILKVIPGTTWLSSPIIPPYFILVGTTWLLTWLFMQGPLRVLHLRWRFEGGKVLALAPGRLRRRYSWPNAGTAEAAADSAAGASPPAEAEPEAKPAAVKPAVTRADPPVRAEPGPAEPGPLAQGVLCGNGHFSHPQARYCTVCGTAVLPRTSPATYGPRPPAGILILADGSTAVLDHDLTLTTSEPGGELAFHPAGEYPRTVAQIRLIGWQPVISSPVRAIWLFLPGGSNLRIEPNVPVPLVPGAELTLGMYRLRYESPHQGWLADLESSTAAATTAGLAAAGGGWPAGGAGRQVAASSGATARWVPRPERTGWQAAGAAAVTTALAAAVIVGFASIATDQHGGPQPAAGQVPILSPGPAAPGGPPPHARTSPVPPGSSPDAAWLDAVASGMRRGQLPHGGPPGGTGPPPPSPTPTPTPTPTWTPSPAPTPSPTPTPPPRSGGCLLKVSLGLVKLRVCLARLGL